jgi:hypothetical protein
LVKWEFLRRNTEYLYGMYAKVSEVDGRRIAMSSEVSHLLLAEKPEPETVTLVVGGPEAVESKAGTSSSGIRGRPVGLLTLVKAAVK